MDKKLLICGSIIAIVVLVLASFSPVVGFVSIKSSVKDSPLFSVRTQRAIGQESEGLTSNYLRKGDLIQFPIRNGKTVQFQKIIDTVKGMDDKTFNRFIEQVAHRYRRDHKNMEISLETIITELILIRKNADNLFREPTSRLLCLWQPTEGPVCFLFLGVIPYLTALLILFYLYSE